MKGFRLHFQLRAIQCIIIIIYYTQSHVLIDPSQVVISRTIIIMCVHFLQLNH